MDLHRIIVFFHVAAMVGLFAALAIEGVSLWSLRRATSYEQAREWAGLWRLLVPLGIPSVLVVLASGVYLATTLGLWQFGWVEVAVPTLVIVAVAGGIIGPRRIHLQKSIATNAGALPSALKAELRHPLLVASWRFRAALLLGLVFEMTTKLDSGSVWLMAGASVIGIGWGLPILRTTHAASEANP
jgi:hypothetical protein